MRSWCWLCLALVLTTSLATRAQDLERRPSLGVEARALTGAEADGGAVQGVAIERVVPGGSAQRAGLLAGDVIYQLAGDSRYLVDVVNSFHPGRATYVEIEGMGHVLNVATSKRDFLLHGPGPGPKLSPMFLQAVEDWLKERQSGGQVGDNQTRDDFSLLVEQAWEAIQKKHIDSDAKSREWLEARRQALLAPHASRQQAYAAIRSMLLQLGDPATRFLTPEQTAPFLREAGGEQHTGVGLAELLSIDIDERSRDLVVVTPIPNSPAERAGLRPHDVIAAIDGTATKGMTLEDAAGRLRGAPGSRVTLTIRRRGRTLDLSLRRAVINGLRPSVRAELRRIGGRRIGYVAIRQFTADSTRETRQAINDLTGRGADAFILDLRNNPGGNLLAARQIAGFFIGARPIAEVRRKSGVEIERAEGTRLTNKPLAMLINEGTASAAELLAAGLYSNHRGRLVGAKTFGKGLIHSLETLPDGSSLVITVGRIRTLEGREILVNAILPDVIVARAHVPPRAAASRQDTQFSRAAVLLN